MQITRPTGIRAGFYAHLSESGVPGLIHAGDQWAPPSWFIVDHAHDVWEFYLQVAGPPTRWRVGRIEYDVPSGGLLAVPPSVIHQMVRRVPERWHFYFLAVDITAAASELPDIAAAWSDAGPVFFSEATAALAPFEAVLREISTSQPLRQPALALATQYLLVAITRLRISHGHRRQMTMHPAIARAREILQSRYGEPLRLKDVAHEVGLSATYLAELFEKQVGLPPVRFRTEIRMRRARVLLTETNQSITDIAAELGYSSPQHFATAFRHHTGQRPRELRRPQARNAHLASHLTQTT